MSELLPCPFCGGEANVVDHHNDDGSVSVGCNNDTCLGFSGLGWLYKTEAEAIAAWNSRAERTCRETTIDKFFNGCDSCGYMWQFFYSIGKRERPNYCPNCGARVVG